MTCTPLVSWPGSLILTTCTCTSLTEISDLHRDKHQLLCWTDPDLYMEDHHFCWELGLWMLFINRSAVFSGSLHWLKPNKHRIRLGAQTEARARASFILTITVFCRLLGQIVKNEFSALLPFTWLNFVFFLRSFWSKKTEKISQVVIEIHDLRHHFKELAACLYRYNMQSRQKVHTCKCG